MKFVNFWLNFVISFIFSYELLITYFHEFPKFPTSQQWRIGQFCQIAALHSSVSWLFTFLKSAVWLHFQCQLIVYFFFRLYGDDALDNALNSFVKLLLSIPQSDLLVSHYFKLKSANFWFRCGPFEKTPKCIVFNWELRNPHPLYNCRPDEKAPHSVLEQI